MSMIYLSKRKDKEQQSAYTYDNTPKKIFIGSKYKKLNFKDESHIRHISNVLAHEELHNILQSNRLSKASEKLDNIVEPSFHNKNKLVNPRTSKNIIGYNKKIKLYKKYGLM